MNATHLTSPFGNRNMNGVSSPQKVLNPGTPFLYPSAATIPFASEPGVIKQEFAPSAFAPPLPCPFPRTISVPSYGAYNDKSGFRKNLFGCADEDLIPFANITQSVPPVSSVDDFAAVASAINSSPHLLYQHLSELPSTASSQPLFFQQQEQEHEINGLVSKYQDLSVSVPEFVPRSSSRNISESPGMAAPSSEIPVNMSDPAFAELINVVPENTNPVPCSITYQENVNGTVYFYTTPSVNAKSPSDAVLRKVSVSASPVLCEKEFHSQLDSASDNFLYSPTKYGTQNHCYNDQQLNGSFTGASSGYYIPEDVEEVDPSTQLLTVLPQRVKDFHSIELIGESIAEPSASFPGCITSIYKAVHDTDGITYCLRRIHGMGLPSAKCNSVINTWKQLSHTNLVQLHDIFVTQEFNDESLIFVYDYYKDCKTLLLKHFPPRTDGFNSFTDAFSSDPKAPRPLSHTKNALLRQQYSNMILPECLLWNYAIQLSGALRVIHAAGLSCHCISPTKIICIGSNRIKIGGLGINDVIMFDHSLTNRKTMTEQFQQDDLVSLGKLLLAMACGSLIAIQEENMSTSLEVMSKNYSKDIRDLISNLLSNMTHKRSVTDLLPLIGARFYSQIDAMQLQCDTLQSEKLKEVDSQRLLKLAIKFSVINKRLNCMMDLFQEEDKVCLLLFWDYLYNQVTEDNRPRLDLSHVIRCLSKLENGSAEKVFLQSKDDDTCIEMSYHEIKHRFEKVFRELSYYSVYSDEGEENLTSATKA